MNYLVEQRNSNGTILIFTNEEPKRSNTVYVFPKDENLFASFLTHTKKRPGALNPINRTFSNNLNLLLTNFPRGEKSWLVEYLMDIMPLDSGIPSNVVEGWKNGLVLYNSSQTDQNLKVDREIKYLENLLVHVQTVFIEKLNSKNERVLKEEIALIDELKNGSGATITTSIDMEPTLRANVAEIIGKQYDAHLMVSSEANENKLKNFFIHEGIFNWLKKIPNSSVGTPELASSLTIGSISIILKDSNVPKGQDKNSFYPGLMNAIEAIAAKCNYRLEITPIPTMSRSTSDGEKKKSSPTPVRVSSWQEKLNELASEVNSQMSKPSNITTKNIANNIRKCFVSKSDYESSKGIEDLNTRNKEKTVFRLDNWQTSLVESILNGESVIAIGPTSGGKTLTSMVALDQLFRRGGDTTLMYVAPNFYQAFQAYCSMVKTFPRQTFGLITGMINSNPKGCKYWVGTPEHLWTFARASDMKFNIGIIDEIHTISSPESISVENRRKASCLVKLISLIKNQFVGLSATIHPDDEAKLAKYVQNILSENGIKISVEYGLGGNKIKRFIPLVNKVFTGNDILDVSEVKADRNIRVTPENTFKLMKILNDKKMTPSLIFDMEEKASYTLFSSLVKYMNDKYQEEYVTWRAVNSNFSSEIANLNREIASEMSNLKEDRYAKLKSKKDGLIQRIISYISTKIRSALDIKEIVTALPSEEGEDVPVKIWPGSQRPRRPRVVIPEDELTKVAEEKKEKESSLKNLNLIEVSPSLRNMAPGLTSGQEFTLPDMIPQEIADLYDELRNLKLEIGKQDLREMFEVCSGIGSYYRFGPAKKSNVFRQLYSMDKTHITKEDETSYNIIASLSDAEGVKFDDVKQIFKLMDIALSFGVGILIPTMPFCVQFQIMKMLKEGDITIVFASESLSMGVNFPAKSCVIRTLQNGPSDITKVLQMGGRAGRRGAITDLEAYSITWNISNTDQIDEAQKNANNMPRLVLDSESIKNRKPEVMVESHKKIAIELNMIMSTAASIEALKQTTAMMEKTTTKLTRGKKIISDEDETKAILKEATGKKSKVKEDYDEEEDEERKTKTTQNKESFSRDTSAVSAITRAVSVLALDLDFDAEIVERLNKRIEYITKDVVKAEMLDNPYEWAERINLVKQALQEVHTGLYKRKCVNLLDYISTLYILVHRISMRYIGLVYQKDSSRTTK